jgi:hypothetical protein
MKLVLTEAVIRDAVELYLSSSILRPTSGLRLKGLKRVGSQCYDCGKIAAEDWIAELGPAEPDPRTAALEDVRCDDASIGDDRDYKPGPVS